MATASTFAVPSSSSTCATERESSASTTPPSAPIRSLIVPQPARHGAVGLVVEVVELGDPDPAQLEHVPETARCHEGGLGTMVLKDCVGRDGRAVDDIPDACCANAKFRHDLAERNADRLTVIVRSGENLATGPTPIVGEHDEVGERASDICADAVEPARLCVL